MPPLEPFTQPELDSLKSNTSQQRYTISQPLGEGGLGLVCRGYDNKLNREVAIKRLLPSETESTLSHNALLQEALMLASLNHSNIVTVYDVYEEEEDVCIVMELLQGVTLDHTIEESRFTIEEFSELVEQTQSALIAAHNAGVVHGDIKPKNIINTKNERGHNQYVLLDFDQARISDSRNSLKRSHSACGSIFFMAPELFEGTDTSHISDTYAIGCVYYFALSGELPFKGNSTTEIMAAHLRNDIVPLNKVRPNLPQWLCQWTHSLMAREPSQRPQSPSEIKDSYTLLFNKFDIVPQNVTATPEAKQSATCYADSQRWYLDRGDEACGPYTWATIQNLIQTNSLKASDLIKNEIMPNWVTTKDLLANILKQRD